MYKITQHVTPKNVNISKNFRLIDCKAIKNSIGQNFSLLFCENGGYLTFVKNYGKNLYSLRKYS